MIQRMPPAQLTSVPLSRCLLNECHWRKSLHDVFPQMHWSDWPISKHFLGNEKQICNIDISQGFWPSPTDRNWLEITQEIQARLHLGSCWSRGEQEQGTHYLACWLPKGVGNFFFIWGEGKGVSTCQSTRVAWVVCPPLCGVECRGRA